MKESNLTLEKMEINKRLIDLEVLIATLKARWDSEFGSAGTEGNLYRIFNDLKEDINKVGIEISVKQLVAKEDFESHVFQDRWMFGIIITMLIGIFIKLFFN